MLKHFFYGLLTVIFVVSCTGQSRKKSGNISETDTIVQNVASIEDDRQFLVQVGDYAPDFEMQLPEGGTVTLSSLRGKVVMLQFTASWCSVCRKEMPYIESQIWQKHKDNPSFALYGIDREEPVEKIEELRRATKVTYPIGMDPEADIFKLYAEENAGITRNIIIDKDGRIVMLTRLFEEEEFNHMVNTINQLLTN